MRATTPSTRGGRAAEAVAGAVSRQYAGLNDLPGYLNASRLSSAFGSWASCPWVSNVPSSRFAAFPASVFPRVGIDRREFLLASSRLSRSCRATSEPDEDVPSSLLSHESTGEPAHDSSCTAPQGYRLCQDLHDHGAACDEHAGFLCFRSDCIFVPETGASVPEARASSWDSRAGCGGLCVSRPRTTCREGRRRPQPRSVSSQRHPCPFVNKTSAGPLSRSLLPTATAPVRPEGVRSAVALLPWTWTDSCYAMRVAKDTEAG